MIVSKSIGQNMKLCNFLWIFSLPLLCHGVQAKTLVNLEELLTDSRAYLRQEIRKNLNTGEYSAVKIVSQAIDTRLTLHPCDKSLTYTHRDTEKITGSVLIKVSCSSPYAWSIYTKHKVALEKKVITANKNLPRHHILSEDDLSSITLDIYKQRAGYTTDKKLLIGQQVKRRISVGNVIYSHQLKIPLRIKKGDTVNVTAKVGALSVITSGIALTNGRKGEQIDVKNRRSSRIVRAEITGTNSVKVIM
jgi:flagella basal body P-ring formation protein FlgA